MLSIELIDANHFLLSGRIDFESHDELESALETCTGEILLDMSGIEYINSAGLGLILGSHQRLHEDGGRVRIVHPTPFVQEVFDITGLDNLVDVSI